MRILIHSRYLTSDTELRSRAEEALKAALEPVEASLMWADLYMTDENGPRGGPDKRCRVVAHLRTGPVVVTRTGTNPIATVSSAGLRCRRLVRSRLARRRHRRRRAVAA